MKPSLLQITSAMLLCGATFGHLKADDKLVITTAGGTTEPVSLSDISRISFEGDKMVVATTDGTADFKLSDIASINFDLSTSAIDEIQAALDEITVNVAGGILSVTAPDGLPVNVMVYNLKGMPVSATNGTGSVTVDFNSLPSGIYIVRANDKTIKFIK